MTSLLKLREEVGDCQRCGLCETRKNIVFGQGDEKSPLMFIGEAPGKDEDESGSPFVGRSGKLLNELIGDIGYGREHVFINNVLMCRPPGNRDPSPEEISACKPFLLKRIALIKPAVIITLGKHASTLLLGEERAMGDVRGKSFLFGGSEVIPTYHPSYVLRGNTQALDLMKQDFALALTILISTGHMSPLW